MVFLSSEAKEGIIIETSIVAPGAARKPGWSSWWLTEQATGLCDNRLCQKLTLLLDQLGLKFWSHTTTIIEDQCKATFLTAGDSSWKWRCLGHGKPSMASNTLAS
jgi:hypothetical protein